MRPARVSVMSRTKVSAAGPRPPRGLGSCAGGRRRARRGGFRRGRSGQAHPPGRSARAAAGQAGHRRSSNRARSRLEQRTPWRSAPWSRLDGRRPAPHRLRELADQRCRDGSGGSHGRQFRLADGSATRPMKRTAPVSTSRTKKRNGRFRRSAMCLRGRPAARIHADRCRCCSLCAFLVDIDVRLVDDTPICSGSEG